MEITYFYEMKGLNTMAHQDKIRVLLAQFPIETHNRGLITVAGMLRDAGMEVIILGNALAEHIIEAAVQEGVDVVGISTYCGGELVLGEELLKIAEKKGIKNRVVFVLGGIFPPSNAPKLKEVGFSATFPPSATSEEIVATIKSAVAAKRGVTTD
jgi:methylmalonyl-CoA mutase C-terminal domain/subunit